MCIRLWSPCLQHDFHPKGTTGRVRTRCLALGPQSRSPISHLLHPISALSLVLVVGVYQAPTPKCSRCQQYQNIAGWIEVQRKTEYRAVGPGCSGRVGNERLTTDFPGRIRFVRLPYSVIVCRTGGRGDAGYRFDDSDLDRCTDLRSFNV